MGADLCYQIQKKEPSGWVPVSNNFSNDRSYLLYAWLGLEARNDGTISPIAPLRGLPVDIKLGWDSEYGWDDSLGEHSQSWLLSDEILASARPVLQRNNESGTVVDEFCAEIKRLHDLHGTVRIVMGFTG